MTINDWLNEATKTLEKVGVGTARLDCLVLLEDITSKDRAWLLAHSEFELSKAQIMELDNKIKLRIKHIPLAFIRGKTEFYGREFIVNKDVLEPRPESETMIDLLKKLPEPEVIIDIGTGSGALAITAKLEIPLAQVTCTDIDPKCIKVAKQNAKKQSVSIDFLRGDLLEPFANKNLMDSVLLCNLPYVPTDYKLNDAAMNEPKIAIFGGYDGLDLYRKLFKQINTLKQKPRYVLTESLPFQHKELTNIAQKENYKLQKTDDFIQLFEYSI